MSTNGQCCPVRGCGIVTEDLLRFCDQFNSVHLKDTAEDCNHQYVRAFIRERSLKPCLQCTRHVFINDSELRIHLRRCRSCPGPHCDYINGVPWDSTSLLGHLRSRFRSRQSARVDASLHLYFTHYGVTNCDKCFQAFAIAEIHNHRGKCVGAATSDVNDKRKSIVTITVNAQRSKDSTIRTVQTGNTASWEQSSDDEDDDDDDNINNDNHNIHNNHNIPNDTNNKNTTTTTINNNNKNDGKDSDMTDIDGNETSDDEAAASSSKRLKTSGDRACTKDFNHQHRSSSSSSSSSSSMSIVPPLVPPIVPHRPTTTSIIARSFCGARPFRCTYSGVAEDMTAHEQQCAHYSANKVLIAAMKEEGTWEALSDCMEEEVIHPLVLSDPELNAMAERCFYASNQLHSQYQTLRHLDLIASTSDKIYEEAKQQIHSTMAKLVSSTVRGNKGTGTATALIEQALQVIAALQEQKSSNESAQKLVCEHIDLINASMRSVLELNRHYKEQITDEET